MSCVLGLEPAWHHAILSTKGAPQSFWINVISPTGEVKESVVRVKGLISKRCEVETAAASASSSAGGMGASSSESPASMEREELALAAAISASQHSAHVPARLANVNVLESDGVSSIGLEVSLSPVISSTAASTAPVGATSPTGQTIYAFAPVMAWRSAAAAELSDERAPLPRVHCVALSHGATGVVLGCANARAYACGLPPLPVEDEDDEPGAAGSASSAPPPTPTPVRALAHGESVQLEGHIADVTCASWFPSDKVVLTGSSDLRLRVHDAATGACAATLVGHAGGIAGIAIIERGRQVASVSRDRTLRVWSVPDRAALFTVPLGDAAPTAAALLDGHLIGHAAGVAPATSAAAPAGSTAGTGGATAASAAGGAASGDTVVPLQGKAVAVPCDDGLVRIVDLASRSIIASVPVVPADAVGLPGSLAAAPVSTAVDAAPADSASGGAGAGAGAGAAVARSPASATAGPAAAAAAAAGASASAIAGGAGSGAVVSAAVPAPWWCSYASGHKALCISVLATPAAPAATAATAAAADAAAASASAATSVELRMLVGGTDGHVSLWDVAPLYDVSAGRWGSSVGSPAAGSTAATSSTSAFEPRLLWRGQVSLTGAEVLSVEQLPSLSAGEVTFLAALSDGTCAIFTAGAGEAQPRCVLQLTGPNCEAVRSVSVRGADSASPDSYVSVATACNDGYCRLYRIPQHVLRRPMPV